MLPHRKCDPSPAAFPSYSPSLLPIHLRSCAELAGLKVTFMPKPFANRTGSGCHTHVSVWGADGTADAGKNLFLDPAGELGISDMARSFLGVRHGATAPPAMPQPSVIRNAGCEEVKC